MAYRVDIRRSAQRDIDRLEAKQRERVLDVLRDLEANPRPAGCQKLKARTDAEYRVRVGDHRIVYAIDDAARIVDVRRVGDRKEVYR